MHVSNLYYNTCTTTTICQSISPCVYPRTPPRPLDGLTSFWGKTGSSYPDFASYLFFMNLGQSSRSPGVIEILIVYKSVNITESNSCFVFAQNVPIWILCNSVSYIIQCHYWPLLIYKQTCEFMRIKSLASCALLESVTNAGKPSLHLLSNRGIQLTAVVYSIHYACSISL